MICGWCGEPVLPAERADNKGADFHRECLFRMLSGSAAHILRECTCYGGTRQDPPGMSKREAARLALAAYRAVNRVDSTA